MRKGPCDAQRYLVATYLYFTMNCVKAELSGKQVKLSCCFHMLLLK